MPKRLYKKKELTNKQIIALFKYHKPKTLREVTRLGIKTTFFAKGIDRRVYRIGKSLALKIEDHRSSSFDQTPYEIQIFKMIHRNDKYKRLRRHIPKLYYADAKSKIILLKFYPGELEDDAEESYEYQKLYDLINELLPQCEGDLHVGNFRYASNGTLMCIDLGYN